MHRLVWCNTDGNGLTPQRITKTGGTLRLADWVKNRMREAQWCEKNAVGCSIQTKRRRVQLLRGWSLYMACCTPYSLHLPSVGRLRQRISPATGTRKNLAPPSDPVMDFRSQSCCRLITGDPQTELLKLPPKSVNVIVCSPPSWVKTFRGGTARTAGPRHVLGRP